jgi:hypothetical protein
MGRRSHTELNPLSRTAGEGGPSPLGWVGDGLSGGTTLTRLASLGTLSRGAGEGS